ncbi:anthranilate phosphoribosyltransferase [Alkalihalobacillus sp. FSL R5-0424]
MFKQFLEKCAEGQFLDEHESYAAMDLIMKNEAEVSQIASLISMMRLRGESVDELVGFARAMRAHAISIPHQVKGVLDTCGTGGDRLGTFNISTAVSFVAAAASVPVAKHGNRAVTSKSGSADVLEYLGINIQQTPVEAANALSEKGLSFLFAPLYHSSMKYAAPARKQIGFRTIFNLLGPLTNPAGAAHQLIGVSGREHALKMGEAIRRLGTTHTVLVTGKDNLDECSVYGTTQIVDVIGDTIQVYELDPQEVGLDVGELSDIQVESVEQSAVLIQQVFEGCANQSATSTVLLNAGVALYAANHVSCIQEGVHRARGLLESKKVLAFMSTLNTQQQGDFKHA